jgi:hypothetical protein
MQNNELWDVNQPMIDNYLQACVEFVDSDEKFAKFKADSRYTPVLEHLDENDANIYFSEFKCKELLNVARLKKIKENDIHGSPLLINHSELGVISPTTIRYIKNSLDIFATFGPDLNFNSVLEIGGGYGGLCKVFSAFSKFKEYFIVDFPDVNRLSEKYLSKFKELKNKVKHISAADLKEVANIDLVISNYAYSECSLVVQEAYYNMFIRNSKHFYMVYNNFTENNMNSQVFMDMASKEFEIHYETESRPPHTNHIIYGTKIKNEN